MSPELKAIVEQLKVEGQINPITGKVLMPAIYKRVWDTNDNALKYEFALFCANKYMSYKYGIGWDDTPDINTLDSVVETTDFQGFVSEIGELCRERIEDLIG